MPICARYSRSLGVNITNSPKLAKIEFEGGYFDTYIVKDEKELQIVDIEEGCAGPLTFKQYKDMVFVVRCYGSKDRDCAKQIFDNLKGLKNFPELVYNSLAIFNVKNRFKGEIEYRRNIAHRIIFPRGFKKAKEGVIVSFKGFPDSKATNIILTDFDLDLLRPYKNGNIDLSVKKISINNLDGYYKELKGTNIIKGWEGREKVQYYYALCFKYDNMLLHICMPQNYGQMAHKTVEEKWLKDASLLLDKAFLFWDKIKNNGVKH